MVANPDTAARISPTLEQNLEAIPGFLKGLRQWLTRIGKQPYSATTGLKGGYTDPQQQTDFYTACELAATRGHDGASLCKQPGDGFVVLDFDHCRRPDGTHAPIVDFWLGRLKTYAEDSPNGAHAVLKAERRVAGQDFWLRDPSTGERVKVQIFASTGHIVLTGWHIAGLPADVAANQQGLDDFIAALDGDKSPPGCRANGHPPAQERSEISDEEVIERARALPGKDGEAIAGLFDRGRGRANESIDDWQLFLILGKVTRDAEQVDRIARSTTLLRPRWNELRCGAPKSLYDIRRAFAALDARLLSDDRGDHHDDDDSCDHHRNGHHHRDHDDHRDGQPQCSAGTDEVADLKRQLAAAQQALADKTAEFERTLARDQQIIADQRQVIAAGRAELEISNRAHRRALALLMTPHVTEARKKVIVEHLARHGIAFGMPMPERTWPRFLSDEDYREAHRKFGISQDTYRTANTLLEEMGLFAREKHEPAAAPHSQQGRSSGRPYDKWEPVPEAWERYMAQIEAGEAPEPPKRQQEDLGRRQEREKQAKLQREAHEARLRQEAEAARQYKFERDQARREADEAVVAAQQVLVHHQQGSARIVCHSCGTILGPEQVRCADCHKREGGQVPEQLGSPAPTLDNEPRFLGVGGELIGPGPINSQDGQEGGCGMNGPPVQGLFGDVPADAQAQGRCSDCATPIPAPAIGAGRCTACRRAEYERLGTEDGP